MIRLYETQWLWQFLQRTRRRFWFINSLEAMAVTCSGILLWGGLLLFWLYRPQDGWLWALGLAGSVGLCAWFTRHTWRELRTKPVKLSLYVSNLPIVLFALMLMAIWWLSPSSFASLYLYWWLGVLVALVYLVHRLVQIAAGGRTQRIAQNIERWSHQARGYYTALDLSQSLPSLSEQPIFSASLAEARILQVQGAMKLISPVNIVPVRYFRTRAKFLIAVSAIFFSLLLFFPSATTQMMGMLLLPPLTQAKKLHRDMQYDIVVGDISVTYRFPAYTQLPPRTIHNSDGHLEAIKGTEVLLQARAIQPIRGAALLLDDRKTAPLQVDEDGSKVTGRLQLLKTGYYRFQCMTKGGALQRGPTHTMRILHDQYPKIELLSPKIDQEVQEREALELEYQFSDDFGVMRIELVYENLSSQEFRKPQRITLHNFELPPRSGKHRSTWQLQTLPFGAGDNIKYYIEVFDNDTISGPKRSRSAVRHIKIFSPFEQHDKLLARQEELHQRMVILLADLLEAPPIQNTPHARLVDHFEMLNHKSRSLTADFGKLLKAMREDTLAVPYTLIAIDNLLRRLSGRNHTRMYTTYRLQEVTPDSFDSNTHQSSRLVDMLQSQRLSEIPDHEDDVYAFTLLLNRQRLDVLQKLSQQLTQAQNRLRELLEQYRQKRDEVTRQALLHEMQRIERLIREIQRRMQRLSQQVPDEYLNLQAFRDQKSLDHLSKMRQMLQKNDLEAAAQELANMARSVERMVSQMDRYAKEGGGQMVSQMAAAIQEMIDRIHQLEQKQERLAKRTQKVEREVSKRMQKAMQKKLKEMLKKQIERAQKILSHLEHIAKTTQSDLERYRSHLTHKQLMQHAKDLEQVLEQGDVYEALQIIPRYNNESNRFLYELNLLQRLFRSYRPDKAKNAVAARKRLISANKLAQAIRRDLEKMFPSPQDHLTSSEQQQLKRYRDMQQRLRNEAEQLHKRFSRMAQQMPVFKPSMQRGIRGASDDMRRASQKLGQSEPQPAHSHQQKAISKLRDVRNQMQQSMQPSSQRRGGQGERQGGQGRGYRHEKIDIPDASSHQAPKELRQDILDAMREKYPQKYKEPVNRYYEKLAK